MRKRLLILCSVGVLVLSVPVYAAPQDGHGDVVQTDEVLSDSSVSSESVAVDSAEVIADDITNAETANSNADDAAGADGVTVTQEADDPVAHVISMIRALPSYDNLTMNDKQIVDEVQTAYDNLSDIQKELVLNRETLERAQQKLRDIRDQSLYTYSFTLTDKYPVARMTLSYAPPSDDSLDTQIVLGSKTGEAAFEIVTPDNESFILTPDTKTYDTKNVHFTVTWSNQSAEIKAENCELGTWLMKSSYPVSFAVQKYESIDEMNGEEKTKEMVRETVSSSVGSSSSESQRAASTEMGTTERSASNPFTEIIIMFVIMAAVGVGAVFLVKFLSKKKFTPQDEDDASLSSAQDYNHGTGQLQNAESMDELDAIMNSKWQTDMEDVPDTPEPVRAKKQVSHEPADVRPVPKKPQISNLDDDYGFSDTDHDYGEGDGNDATSNSMHDSDFMDDDADDDDGDSSRDTTYLSYEEDINEETGILNDSCAPTKITHKKTFYPKNSYDPDSGQR